MTEIQTPDSRTDLVQEWPAMPRLMATLDDYTQGAKWRSKNIGGQSENLGRAVTQVKKQLCT